MLLNIWSANFCHHVLFLLAIIVSVHRFMIWYCQLFFLIKTSLWCTQDTKGPDFNWSVVYRGKPQTQTLTGVWCTQGNHRPRPLPKYGVHREPDRPRSLPEYGVHRESHIQTSIRVWCAYGATYPDLL